MHTQRSFLRRPQGLIDSSLEGSSSQMREGSDAGSSLPFLSPFLGCSSPAQLGLGQGSQDETPGAVQKHCHFMCIHQELEDHLQ